MGRNSGGVVNINHSNGNSAKVQVALNGSRSLSTIKDKTTYNEIFRGISRFHSVLGVREKSVRLADLDSTKLLLIFGQWFKLWPLRVLITPYTPLAESEWIIPQNGN